MAWRMSARRAVPPEHSAFAPLPVTPVAVGHAAEQMAVHVAGRLTIGRPPLVLVAGYQRNMSDFTEAIGLFRRQMETDWPVVALDLKGRGRSADRVNKARYVSTIDAGDVGAVCTALGVSRAIFLGQGYGGQVIMALAAQRPRMIAGTVLIDSGPVSDPRGLVRLRHNLRELEGTRSAAGLRTMFRRMLGSDYPAMPEELLDRLALRTHFLDGRGRVQALFDPHLVTLLDGFEHDDVLVAQWPLFQALETAPLMMMRTQLTEQLRREVFEEMLRRRPDAEGYIIEGQGSPPLLNRPDDVAPIAAFVDRIMGKRTRPAAAAV